MAEIQVPVKLQIQNLQSLVTELQNKLSNLKVGSTGFKNIQNIIQSIRGEIDKLSVQTAKPFVDASQFTKAERSVDRLEDQITKVSIAISRLKFGDLELTDAQKADIKGFEDSINNIKDKIKTVKDAAKEAFLKTDIGQEWVSINPEAATKSLSQITSAIEREVNKQRQELKKLETSAADYQKAIDQNNRVREFLDKSGDDPLSKLNLGEQYDKIFQTTVKNQLRYTPGGRNLLADWLSSQLELDDSTISQIVNKNITAANVTGKLKEILSSQLAADKDLHAKQDANDIALQEKQAQYNQLTDTLNTAAAAQQGITIAEQAARTELANTEAAAASYKDRLVDIARSGSDVQSTTNAMKSQLQGFRSTLEQASSSFLRLQRTQQSFNQMKMAVVNFMGFNQVLNLTKRAAREAINHIKELDTVMNKISIVTNMSTGDLWKQVDQYSRMAQAFGTTIKGAYEVSQIYYQQGLDTNDVLTLTNETLKLAKISGLDYATTTDYMTTALRGFKMEMSEASTVVDVYSNLAAHTAVSSEELAVAMSKTASSMESVGSTFEETSAMIGTMVAVTRESAVNIGSALKSIAARYGEMKKDPLSMIDSEGEEVSFNKVDAALQSVGISLKTTDGQFRDFTDVIIELSEKWDQLESTQQRYIATQFAGNRQQSRFLALVSNKDLLKANIGFAEESEDTGTLQALKALDSIESKLNQVQVAYQQFYTTMGIEDVWKSFLDGAKNVINTLNSLPKLFGKLPVAALGPIMSVVSLIKTIGTNVLTSFASILVNSLGTAVQTSVAKAGEGGKQVGDSWIDNLIAKILGRKGEVQQAMQQATQAPTTTQTGVKVATGHINQYKEIQQWEKDGIETATTTAEYDKLYTTMAQEGEISSTVAQQVAQNEMTKQEAIRRTIEAYQQQTQAATQEANVSTGLVNRFRNFATAHTNLANSMQQFGSALSVIGMVFNTATEGGRKAASTFQFAAGAVSLFSAALKIADRTTKTIPWMALATGILAIVNGISLAIETPEEKLERLIQTAEELNNKAKEAKANYRTLETSKTKLEELEKKRYDSAESAEEYQSAVDDLANKFPELISRFDEAGNAIIESSRIEQVLAKAREETAAATYKAAQAEKDRTKQELDKKIDNAKQKAVNAGSFAGDLDTEINKQVRDNVLSIFSGRDDSKLSTLFRTFEGEINSTIASGGSVSDAISILLKRYYITDNNEEYYFPGNSYGIGDAINRSRVNENATGIDGIDLQSFYQELINIENPSLEVQQFIEILKQLPEFNFTLSNLVEDEATSFEGLFASLKANLAHKDYIAAEQDYEKIQNLIQEYREANLYTNYIRGLEENLGDLGEAFQEIEQYAQVDQNSAKALITSYIANEKREAKFVQEKTGLSDIISERFTKIWHEQEKGLDWKSFLLKYKKDIEEVSSGISNFWNNLSLQGEESTTLFKQMFNNPELYTFTDFQKAFSEIPGWDLIQEYILQGYIERNKNFVDSLTKKKNEIIKSFDKEEITYKEEDINRWNEAVIRVQTASQHELLAKILNQYSELSSQGYIKSASDYINNALDFYNALSQADTAIRTSIEGYFKQYDIATKAGLQGLIDKLLKDDIVENDYLTELLSKLLTNTNDNISLAFQTAIFDFTEAWEKKSKTLDKLTKGLDISDVESVINESQATNVKLKIDDFVMSGDKLVLEANKAAEYYKAVYEAEKASVNTYKTAFDDAAQALGIVSKNGSIQIEKLTLGLFDETGKIQLETLGVNTKDLLDNLGNGTWRIKSNITPTDFYNILSEAYKSTKGDIDNYYTYVDLAYKAIQKDLQWSQGDYSGLPSTLSITDLMQKTEKEIAAFKGQPDIKNAVEKARGATENLLNDIITKGLDLDLSNYEGIPNEIKNEFGKITEKNKYKFVRKYASYLGKTIEETNDFLIQVRQNEDESKVAAKEALKDITFYSKDQAYASLDSIKKVADILDVSVDDIIGQYNELLGGYEVNLNNIDLSSIDGFAEMVKESINGIIKNIVGFASSAISGKLSQQDQLNFNAQLKALGLSAINDIDFIKTADGLKISQTAAINLYNELRKVDGIQAKLVFDDLNKSLQESNEHYKSISDIANRIKEIESIVPDARSKEYEQELALAKQIYAVRSTTEDSSFSFMSNKIPGGQNNPINYFNNWAKAIHTFNDALKTKSTYYKGGKSFKSGVVDYDFWYNLVTEMNNIARTSGTDIEFAGMTLDGKLESAAALIQKGADALVVTDTGEVKVALSKISTDFKSGTDAFSGGVTDGIQALAKSQSEMLDGMIKVLETIVAMEGLEDLGGDNRTIKISDILPDITWDTEGKASNIPKEFNKKYSDWTQSIIKQITGNKKTNKEFNENLANAMNSIKIDGSSLASIITWDTSKLAGMGQEFNESYATFLNAMVQAAASDNYDLTNIWSSVKDILAASGLTDITIDIDDITYGLSYGVLIEKTPTGYKSTSGKEYSTMKQAAEASLLEDKDIENITVDADGKVTGTVKYDQTKFTVEVDKNGKTIWKDRTGNSYPSEAAAAAKAYEEYKGHADSAGIYTETYSEWSIRVFGKLVLGEVVIENEDTFKTRTHEQVTELAEALATNSTKDIVAKAKAIGINVSVNGELTEDQRKQIAELAGIEDKIVTISVKENAQEAEKNADNLIKKIKELDALSPEIDVSVIDNTKTGINAVLESLKSIPSSKNIDITTSGGTGEATGNASASGNALAQGTLMGELGPELVVSKGRYFIAGQNGPEMVNLADDAIVFNHLQTESLLTKGMSKGRGKAVTNERNAVSFATGNVNGGPAKASASAALATLRQLKAQWDALAGLSAKDLAGKAGGGGGGGGNAAFIKDLERWYNLLQQIATLEQKITYEQSKRAKIQSSFNRSGQEYFNSQKDSLKYLEQEIQKHQQLADEQQEYFKKRQAELNKQSAFSELYTFDENGQIQYKSGKFAELSQRFGGDSTTGKPNYTVKEQYDWLISQGYGYAMEYNESGEKIEVKDAKDEAGMKSAIEAFWAKIESDKSEMQGLHDSIDEHKKAVLEKQQAQNEILKEIEDNQINVENKVMHAIEDAAKREIDELKDQKDAIKESNEKLIKGLSDQLNLEKQMYATQQAETELESKRRRLAILQRSGASASEISSLQKEIDNDSREQYFNKQQEQIDAIQEASDNEIEKLEKQIDLMEETLEYQKQHGLLWERVYEVMNTTPENIASFIQQNDSAYWGKSPADLARNIRDDLFEAEKWLAFAAEGVEIKDYVAKIAKEIVPEGSGSDTSGQGGSGEGGQGDDGSGGSGGGDSSGSTGKDGAGTKRYRAYYDIYDDRGFKTNYGGSGIGATEAEARRNAIALMNSKIKGNGYLSGHVTRVEAYDEGGMNYRPGMALLHGTKSRPESVLNATQTKILRDNILSNRPDSLISLLQSYNEAYRGLSNSTYDSISNNSNSVVIEHAEVNMHVAKMDNSYDAAKAGDDVMREILNIASKTVARNRII